MFDPRVELLTTVLRRAAENPTEAHWREAREAFVSAGDRHPELEQALERHDVAGIAEIANAWHDGTQVLLRHDRDVLKRAMKSFLRAVDDERRRREESARFLDDQLAAFSPEAASPDFAIRPPEQFPIDVWEELARHHRLVDKGHGEFGLPSAD